MKWARFIVVVAVALVAVHVAALGALGSGPSGKLVSNVVQLLAPLLAAVVAGVRARGSSAYAANFWRLMSTGFGLWAVAQALYIYYENYLGQGIPNLSLSDIPYLLYYFPLAAAVFLWPEEEEDRTVQWIHILDLAQVAIVLTAIYLYYFVFIAFLASSRQEMLRLGIINLYDILNVLLVGAYLARLATARTREVRSLFGRMSVVVVAYAVGDSLYTLALTGPLGGTGSWLDLGYSTPFAVAAGMAATWRPPESGSQPIPSVVEKAGQGLRTLLPVMAPLVVLGLAAKIASEEFDLALIVVGASVLCYSGRLALTQRLQQRAMKMLQQSESRYRDLVENMSEVVYSVDLEGKVTYVTPAVERLYGYKPDELIGRNWLEFVPPEDREVVTRQVAERLAGTTSGPVRRRLLTRSGELRWTLGSSRATLHEGRVVGLTGVFMDVHERVRAEQALHESEARYRELVENMNEVVYSTDLEGRITYVSPSVEKLYGYKPEELIGRSMLDFVPPEDRKNLTQRMDERKSGITPGAMERRVLTRSGELRWILGSSRAAVHEGRVVGVTGLIMDVHDRVLVEQALHESESRYRELVENMAETVYVADTAGNLTYVSPAVERLLGYKPEEVMGRSILDFVPPEDRTVTRQYLDQALEGNLPAFERRVLTKSGEARWVWGGAHGILQDGRVVGASGVILDVHDRVQAEQALRESEEKLSKLFRASPDAITISTLDEGRYLEANESFLRLTGYSRQEVIGRTAHDLQLWADPVQRALLREKLQEGGAIQNLEVTFRMRSGQQRVFLLSADVVELEGRKCLVAFSRDITERRLLEEQFRQAQKMEAVGRLAGGIAHDFNNILTVISGYAQLLQEHKDLGIAEEIGSIAEAASRAATLTRQLLAFGRQQVLEPRVISLNETVRGIEKMLGRLIGEDVELVTVLAPDLGAVKADPSQIEQILMNLVVNARDAMPGGGRIIIETMHVDLSHSYVQEHRVVEPGSYVMLAVSDSGTGMDIQTQAHIFEPFFTTKELGRGTGLGLSTVYGIVKQSQGHIWVYSEIGHGTTFKIYLPRVPEAARAERPEPQPASVTRGEETILLVEDDLALRQLAVKILRREGYTVLEAESSIHAENICRRHPGQIDLILTDMIMPEMSGRELVERVRALRPRVRVLYMSGYTEHAAGQQPGLQIDAPLLSKPFSSAVLSSKIREVLRQPAA